MIPAEVATRLRLTTPEQPAPIQATTPTRAVTDVLSDLVPGQRIFAEIQALMPNGMYRAVVGQRDVTLALPFSAKPGDSLELEVLETDGKISLAFVANRGDGKAAESTAQSVATHFSQTGRLIGDLLAGLGRDGKPAPPAALNGNQPLVANMPATAQDLAPILKDALSKSGMFYEAHQARWAEGKLSTDSLLEQPQGKLSPALQENRATPANQPANQPSNSPTIPAGKPEEAANITATQERNAPQQVAASPVRSELTPLVQQQLDALASQNYVWQGQVWPGQQMHWEIQEENDGSHSGDDDSPDRWQTRLQLTLPNLGGIEASIHLRSAKDIEINVVTTSENGHISLIAAAGALRQQLESAGLNLVNWSIKRGESTI